MPARRRRPATRRDDSLILTPPGAGQDTRSGDLMTCLLDGSVNLDGAAEFATEADEKRCWELNRDLIMSLRSDNPRSERSGYLAGQRPRAWWKYESGISKRILGNTAKFGCWRWHRWQFDYLVEHKMIDAEERAAAVRVCAMLLQELEGRHAPTTSSPGYRKHLALRRSYEIEG